MLDDQDKEWLQEQIDAAADRIVAAFYKWTEAVVLPRLDSGTAVLQAIETRLAGIESQLAELKRH
jgi:hypothetical protein